MSGNTKAIGVAFNDQDLDGSGSTPTMSNYAVNSCTINASTIKTSTVTSPTITSPTITGTVTIGANATNLVGFFGAPAVVQPTSSNEAATSATLMVTISATQWCFSTSTQGNALVTLVNQLRADLVALGVIKGS